MNNVFGVTELTFNREKTDNNKKSSDLQIVLKSSKNKAPSFDTK